MSLFNWFQERFGRGSRVDELIRALPNPERCLAGLDAWAQSAIDIGDKIEAWNAEESRLVEVLRVLADANDWAGPLIGGVVGEDKREALGVVLRRTARLIGMGEQTFDLAWRKKLRPRLDAYIARLRG